MCNNTSNNDKMIEEMANLLENFLGAANQTQCFLHILNLTAKSILQQFEIPSKKKTGDSDNDGDETISNAMSKLLALSTEIEDDPSRVDDLQVGDKDDEGGVSEDNALVPTIITDIFVASASMTI